MAQPAQPTFAARAQALRAHAAKKVFGSGVSLYVFGKHPAWRDFIDVRLLPPVPKSLKHFHNVVRPVIEADFNSNHRPPVNLAWRDGRDCNFVVVLNSHDAVDPRTNGSRRSPLFLGCALRNPEVRDIYRLITRLDELAAEVTESNVTAEQFVAAVKRASESISAEEPDPNAVPAVDPSRIARLQQWVRITIADRKALTDAPKRPKNRRRCQLARIPRHSCSDPSAARWTAPVVQCGFADKSFELVMIRRTNLCFLTTPPLPDISKEAVKSLLPKFFQKTSALPSVFRWKLEDPSPSTAQ